MSGPSPQELATVLAGLPHGPEFRFVDELQSLTPGESAQGSYRIRGDEAFLAGHFPDSPLMPGVILIEALAQLGGIVAQSDPNLPPLSNLRLTAVRNAKILGAAEPGHQLQIEARLSGRLGNLVQVEGTVRLEDGTEVLRASIALSGD